MPPYRERGGKGAIPEIPAAMFLAGGDVTHPQGGTRMKLKMFAMAFGLALLWTLPDVVGAQGFGGLTGVAQHRFEPTLIVDARPLEAQVLLDGRPIGLAGALAARAITVTPGPHTVEIGAPGFVPYAERFVADRTGANQFVVTLAPQ